VGRSLGVGFVLGFSNSLVGISISTDPTLYGPVCAGKVGVGFMRLNHVMLTIVRELGSRTACGSAPKRDLYAREKDSVVVADMGVLCCGSQWSRRQ
jgi:hypothetical protein